MLIPLNSSRVWAGMQRIALFGVVILLLMTNTASAASFDCAKATTKVEKRICANAELSKLDGELGKVYSEALAKYPDYVSNYHHLPQNPT